MAQFFIEDSDFASLKGKVVVITGGSSGIGLATVKLLLSLDAYVVVGDQNPAPITHANLTFQQTNVTSWTDLLALFAKAKTQHGRIDHVFANAGIAGRAHYLEDNYDATTGELQEPSTQVFDINLRGMINTAYLGIHHMRHQERLEGSGTAGSIVCTASASSFQRFRVVDYTAAKHGVLGFMRGMVPSLRTAELSVRVNCIAPSWTRTGLVPEGLLESLGYASQGPEVVARSVAVLMADEGRQGQLIYSVEGRFYEIEETRLLPASREVVGRNDEDVVMAIVAKKREDVSDSEDVSKGED